jgi:hypothetical protein
MTLIDSHVRPRIIPRHHLITPTNYVAISARITFNLFLALSSLHTSSSDDDEINEETSQIKNNAHVDRAAAAAAQTASTNAN